MSMSEALRVTLKGIGGGGGSRTLVRKGEAADVYMCSLIEVLTVASSPNNFGNSQLSISRSYGLSIRKNQSIYMTPYPEGIDNPQDDALFTA